MTCRSFIVPGALAAALAMAVPERADAQVGSGWTQFSPMKSIQLRGAGARYTNEGGIETFSTKPGDERAEARIHDDHTSGRWQFEGWVKVSPGVNGGCVHQVFKFLMIVAYPNDGGELRQHSYQNLGTTGAYDRWVRINTIHDATAKRAEIYIDGVLKGTMDKTASGGADGWYHKYGIYNSSGTSPVIQWKEVKFFKGEPGTSGPPVDGSAGPPDAGVDVRVEGIDAASVIIERDAGATASPDTRPAPEPTVSADAARPRADASRPPPDDEEPGGGSPAETKPSRAAGGCRLGSGPAEGTPEGLALVLVLVLAALVRRLRRR
jgi:hypothetical protein